MCPVPDPPSVPPLVLVRLHGEFAVCRLAPDALLAPWMGQGSVTSVTRTPDELSVVVECAHVPGGVRHEGPFVAFMVQGPLDFSLTGILARLSAPLADAGVPIFVLSTFDTDYVLVRSDHAEAAADTWRRVGVVVG